MKVVDAFMDAPEYFHVSFYKNFHRFHERFDYLSWKWRTLLWEYWKLRWKQRKSISTLPRASIYKTNALKHRASYVSFNTITIDKAPYQNTTGVSTTPVGDRQTQKTTYTHSSPPRSPIETNAYDFVVLR